ncbi:FUSC family protein [Sphingomonas sp. DT-207]|uniref:FUSC family protein n=1 Tax=Sphingomonas sp. DT-207 TaxID=3396167 RepID=UPI003F1E0D58
MAIGWDSIGSAARREWVELTTIQRSDRPWEMPVAAALASGGPMLAGAASGRLAEGLIGSLAGLVFLYLPATALQHRMVTLMACAFGMIACYTLGMASHLLPVAKVPIVTLGAVLVTMVCRFYRLGPPGSLFFVMAMAIGIFSPGDLASLPMRAGIFAIGTIHAAIIALIYSLHILRRRPPVPVEPLPPPSFDFVIFDSIVIGLFVGISLAIAELLQLDKPYWVPISCLAVIQGMSLRAAWTRQVHRILGTAIGLLLAWAAVSVVTTPWEIAAAIIALTFVIETAVVRHYGFAAVLITPLAILLTEAPTLGHADTDALMIARFLDTLLGAFIGFLGAACLHSAGFRARVGGWMLRIAGRAAGDRG